MAGLETLELSLNQGVEGLPERGRDPQVPALDYGLVK
jgi:hypothetical protein